MGDEFKFLFASALSFLGLTGVLGRQWQLSNKITEGDRKCHERINALSNEVLRKDDKLIELLLNQQNETNRKLDELTKMMLEEKRNDTGRRK